MMRLGLISDTHAPRFWKAMPPRVAAALRGVDLILHAGDVCRPGVLAELATVAPVRAVLGNNDDLDVAAWGAPTSLSLDLEGLSIAMVHDGGPAYGRLARLRQRFPDADVVVFGHSHIPLHQQMRGLHIINPGSPTDRRRQPHGTVARLVVAGGAVNDVRFIEVS